VASLIGKEIGKYRITERIGRGGMADVYLGIHTHLDRKVAVKVLHSHLLEGGDFVARFKREAKAVANLRHPNIVQVYDFDVQDDMIFMVMEYVDGVSLHSKLVEVGNRGERLPIKLIGSIINDIAGALDYAHSKGMLHRDIKPSNILLDQNDKAYLTDFGIAKLLDDQKFTATGQLVGTPAYMSPEQGMGEDLTEESDIYSLGIVAFEMLTGQVPYDAKTPIGIVHKQINDPIPELNKLVDGVPGTAQEVLNRALAKTPEGRYNRAEDLVKALRVALQALDSTEPIIKKAAAEVEEILDAPTVTMKTQDLDKATVVMEGEKTKQEPEKKPEPGKESTKKKIPTWAYIAGGVAVVAAAALIITQLLGINLSGGGTADLPENAVSVWAAANADPDGLFLIDDIPDGNLDLVEDGGNTAWRTGGGEAIEVPEGNTEQDFYLYFAIDDERMFDLPPGEEVYVDVVYLDQGTDEFLLQYDSHDPNWPADGGFTDSSVLTKTDTGEYQTARFYLTDPVFVNRNGGGDLRLEDGHDGAEIIREIRVVWIPRSEQEPPSEDQTREAEEFYLQGKELLDAGDHQGALEAFTRAIELNPVEPTYINWRGVVYLETGQWELCVADYDVFAEMDPENPFAFKERGDCLRELGDIDAARANYERFLELSEGDPAFDAQREFVLGWLERN
jgi:serine/threonine protein kinase